MGPSTPVAPAVPEDTLPPPAAYAAMAFGSVGLVVAAIATLVGGVVFDSPTVTLTPTTVTTPTIVTSSPKIVTKAITPPAPAPKAVPPLPAPKAVTPPPQPPKAVTPPPAPQA